MKQRIHSLYIFVLLTTILLYPLSAIAKTNMGTIYMEVGESRQLTSEPSTYYTVSGEWYKTGSAISISSSSSRSCTITAIQEGTATVEWRGYINTTWEEMYWTINVTGIPVTEIILNKTSLSLQPGQKESLSVTVKPDNATNKSYSQESNNTSVATISLGTITAKSPGQATITFMAKDGSGVSATCKVTVEGEAPVPSDLLQGDIKQVSTGWKYTMIVMNDGSLWACGRNDYGQLCDGTTENVSRPKKVMDGVEYVATGDSHTMIIKTDGSLWACGNNEYGQLGDETTTNRSTPVKVMDDVATVAASSHTMIVKTDGSLWMCGYNQYFQIGDGTSYDRKTPKYIMSGVKAVSAGCLHSLALKSDGSLWVWGNNYRGQLAGATITSDSNTKIPEEVMTGVSAISAGGQFTMILKTNGSLWACGENSYGQLALGDGTTYTTNRTVKQVMTNVAAVSTGSDHTMIVKNDGTLWACGWNYCGQLGDGTNTDRSSAKQVMSNVSNVITGSPSTHTMILKTDGTLWACGSNDYGQLGDGTTVDRHSPVQISEPAIKVTSITLNKTSLSLETGQSETLTPTISPTNATNQTVTWSSSNTSIATVDNDGKVTAKAKGSATITCKANDGSGVQATCSVTVTDPVIEPTAITISPSSKTITVGETFYASYTLTPSNATTTVTWSSDNTSIATVTQNGLVKGISAGYIWINVKTANGKTDYFKVTVNDPVIEPTAITISPSSKTIDVGETFYASYTLTPSNATTTVTWSSDNESIATVTQTGLVKGISAGSTYINVETANGKISWFRITVNPAPTPVESISLWWSTTVHLDGTKKLTPTISPSDAKPTLTWTSSDTSVATVDQDGVVTGKKIGTATITVTTDNGKSDWCSVKVVKVFTAQTVEGHTMTFQILSEDDKTCQAGEDYTMKSWGSYQVTTWAVPWGTIGQVTIPSTAGGYTVTGIGGLGFLNLRSITSVTIPSTVKEIGYAAFEGCASIETMTIPNSVTDIGSYAFYGCTKLAAITLPNSIDRLRDCLFYGDIALTSIAIPSSVTQIGWGTFDGTGLKEITIPDSVTTIGSLAFANCTSLEKVISMIAEPFEINKNVFENTSGDETSFTSATLYVPKDTKSAYESTSAWNEFEEIIEMEGGSGIKGDVNEDGYVNGTDLVALTNIILGKNPEKPSADVNGDGYVNGTDYVALTNIILGNAASRRMTDTGQTAGSSMLHTEPFAIGAGETKELTINLWNPDDALTLLQFNLQLPKGLTIARTGDDYQADMAGRTSWGRHQLSVYGNDNHARFLLASASNNLIEGTEGAVICLSVTADADFNGGIIAIHSILGVTPDEQEVNMPDCRYSLASGATGIYNINGNQDALEIYSLSGQRRNVMKKGINIVEGKKVIKK